MAGDVGGEGRGHQQDAAGGFFGRAWAAQRDHRKSHLPHRAGDAEGHFVVADGQRGALFLGLRQARVDEAEGDGVAADAEAAPLPRHRLRQPDDAHFGRRVVDLPRLAVQPGGRRDVDDAARRCEALARRQLGLGRLAQVGHDGADHAERGRGMHVEDALPLLVAHLVQHPVPRKPGVVD